MTTEEVVVNLKTATGRSSVLDDRKVRAGRDHTVGRNPCGAARQLIDLQNRHSSLDAPWLTFSKGTAPNPSWKTIGKSVNFDSHANGKSILAGDVRCRSP